MAGLESRSELTEYRIYELERQTLESPIMAVAGMADLQIEQLKEQRKELERKIKDTTVVLRWKIYEICVEREQLIDMLERLRDERGILEAGDTSTQFALNNDIQIAERKIRELTDVLERGEEYRYSGVGD